MWALTLNFVIGEWQNGCKKVFSVHKVLRTMHCNLLSIFFPGPKGFFFECPASNHK